jgi:hypothetical protein
MSHITADEALKARLDGLTKPLEVRDESGRVIGQFVPADARVIVLLASDNCPYSDEELREMYDDRRPGMPLKEFWKSLGQA